MAKSTPKTTYSDAACTIQHPNPVPAGPDGRIPQVFAPDIQTYYLELRSNTIAAGGVLIDSFENVQSLGSTAGDTLSLDFGAGGKFKVRGDSGTGQVHLEFGDPDPDVVGGTATIGGNGGTQLDGLTIDAALLNVTGRVKEGGRKLPGVVRSEAVSFAAATTIDIPLTNDPTGAVAWDIDIHPFALSTTGVGVQVRFSYDNGATYLATATYYSMLTLSDAAGVASTNTLQTAATSGQIMSGANTTNPATMAGIMQMRVYSPNTAVASTTLTGDAVAFSATGNLGITRFGVTNSMTGRATHVRIIIGAGNATGVYRVTPLRGFGEV